MVPGVEIRSLNLVEDEGPQPEPSQDDSVHQPLFLRVPAHSHGHGRSVGQGGSDSEHETVGEGGKEHGVLYGVVGQEHTGAHQGAADQYRHPVLFIIKKDSNSNVGGVDGVECLRIVTVRGEFSPSLSK